MPIYDYKCQKCGFTEINRKEHPDNVVVPCPKCEGDMERLFHASFSISMGACGAYGYYDDNLGCYVSTNAQRKEEMRKQGVTEKGATPKEGLAWA